MDAQPTLPSEKRCTRCCQLKPVSQFRRLHAGADWPRRAACRECRNALERDRCQRQRRRLLKQSVTAMGACQNLERLEAAVSMMLQVCGGPDGLAAELVDLLKKSPLGSVTRRRVHLGVLNALRLLHQQKGEMARLKATGALEEPIDVESLSDEALLDAAADPLRRLHATGCLGPVLRHLVSCGEIRADMLKTI